MRAVVMSRVYADPAARGKLKALAGLDIALAAAVPDRWVPAGLSHEQQTEWVDEARVRTVPVPIRGSAADRNPRWRASALRSLLTDFRPDIIQIEEEPWTRGAAVAARIARRLRVPYVVLTRESLPRSYGPVARYRRNRVLGGAAGLAAVNELAARLALRVRPNLRYRVAPQLGVRLPLTAERLPHTGLSIGFVSRLVPEKGLDLLFRACVKLIGRWSLTVVGTGPAQEELEGLAERLGLAGRVTWLGALPRDGVDQVWPRLDCLVMPSRTTPRWIESSPRAALDAMARGVAVVATSAGALPEILGPAGVLVPEEDVGALTETLQRLHDTPEEHLRLGGIGRRRALDQFSDAAIAERTRQFWAELVSATA
jgi:glycosyltransferase involved in cell wall biosynthesis